MNPYNKLPATAFWKPAVATKNLFDITSLWQPKFKLTSQHKIVTFGSCFAQHIGNALVERGFNWVNNEKSPHGLSESNKKLFNYNVFSARTGNIYTTSLLKQWTEWALDKAEVPTEIWQQDDRFYDPFRPNIEPNGFESAAELHQSQQQAIKSFKISIETADCFVFTLGLTESWRNKEFGYEYPMCPGTVAGEFNSEIHKFHNQLFAEVIKNLREAVTMMREVNPKLKFILTVSPVPLTATMSKNHVLVASMESKSILRAVAGQFSGVNFVDYFPSYEIINSPVFQGVFFEANKRSVSSHGVKFVMDSFFNSLELKFGVYKHKNIATPAKTMEVICEEALLEAFGGTN